MPDSPSNRPLLSVAMIVRNAEDTIATSLDSIAAIADQIVVADTGSTDRTMEVVRKRNATLVQIPWNDDFSAARNQCLLHVKGDWVLWLDAGESLGGDDPQRLVEFVRRQADSSRAYLMLVKVPQARGSIAGEQAARIRLVPNRPGIRFQGRIRESLFGSLDSLGLSVDGVAWRIHRGHEVNELERKQQKARRDLRLSELEISEIGPVARLLNCQGDALQMLENTAQAADCFAQAIPRAEPASPEMLEAFYGLLTALDGSDETREKQLSLCLKALEAFPMDSQLLCAMGGYLQSQGRVDLACRAYETAYQHGQIDPRTWHLDEIRDIAAVCYSLALQLQNKAELALSSLEQALATNPGSERIRRQLTELYIRQCHRERAIETAEQLPQPEALRESLRSAVRGACLASQDNWPAAKAYLQAAYQAGCRDPLCLRWYTITLLTTGDKPTACSVIQRWQEADPTSAEVHRYLERAASPSSGAASTAHSSVRIDPQQHSPADKVAPNRTIVSPSTHQDLSGPPASV